MNLDKAADNKLLYVFIQDQINHLLTKGLVTIVIMHIIFVTPAEITTFLQEIQTPNQDIKYQYPGEKKYIFHAAMVWIRLYRTIYMN